MIFPKQKNKTPQIIIFWPFSLGMVVHKANQILEGGFCSIWLVKCILCFPAGVDCTSGSGEDFHVGWIWPPGKRNYSFPYSSRNELTYLLWRYWRACWDVHLVCKNTLGSGAERQMLEEHGRSGDIRLRSRSYRRLAVLYGRSCLYLNCFEVFWNL